MNLAPIRIEYAHGDGARRPVYVSDSLDRTRGASRVGEQFTKVIERDDLMVPRLWRRPVFLVFASGGRLWLELRYCTLQDFALLQCETLS